MNETPHEPGGSPDDGHGRPGDPPTPFGASGPPPPDATLDDDDDDEDDDYDEVDTRPGRRRFLSGRRLAAVVGVVVILAGAGLALVLTSPGEDGQEGADGSSSDDSTSPEDAAFQFAECMREHGLEDFPDPQVSDEGITLGRGRPGDQEMPAQEREAFEACDHFLGEAGPTGGEDLSPEEVAERQDQALAMAQCMRDRGWDMPDPEVQEDGSIRISIVEGEGQDSVIPEPGDPDADRFQQDQQECHEEAGLDTPNGGGGGMGGGGGDVPERGGS